MQTVIGVRFRNAGKLYYFNPGNLAMSAGNAVIVETSRGIEYAEVIVGPHQVQAVSLAQPLRRVVRVATQEDAAQHEANRQKEIDAHSICAQRITAHKLDMKLVSVEYTFDNNKLIAYFTANGRVDFRALVRTWQPSSEPALNSSRSACAMKPRCSAAWGRAQTHLLCAVPGRFSSRIH